MEIEWCPDCYDNKKKERYPCGCKATIPEGVVRGRKRCEYHWDAVGYDE